MKKLLLVALFTCCCMSSFAQTTAEQRKAFIAERRENMKLASDALGKKVTKLAIKEAKNLKKEGWKPAPGGLPLDIQLTEYYTKMYEIEGNSPRYIIGKGVNNGGNYAGARKGALSLATVDVAAMIESEVTELTELSVSNSGLSAEDAQSIVKTVAASKILVEQSIGNLKPCVEMYRDINGKKEVSVQVLYDGTKARATILTELDKQSKDLQEKVAKLWNDKNK